MTSIIAQLRYRPGKDRRGGVNIRIDVELIEGEGSRSFVIRCPVCGMRARLNEGKLCVTWEMQAGRISVSKAITCPRPECGWHVTIDRNIVRDVDEEPHSPTIPNGISSESIQSRARRAWGGYHPRLPGSKVED